jgi:hypothetical protein
MIITERLLDLHFYPEKRVRISPAQLKNCRKEILQTDISLKQPPLDGVSMSLILTPKTAVTYAWTIRRHASLRHCCQVLCGSLRHAFAVPRVCLGDALRTPLLYHMRIVTPIIRHMLRTKRGKHKSRKKRGGTA